MNLSHSAVVCHITKAASHCCERQRVAVIMEIHLLLSVQAFVALVSMHSAIVSTLARRP